MSLTGSNNEQKIWNYLKAQGFPEYSVAGLMGNLYAESGLNPSNLQNTFEKKLGYTDASYTAAVDNGEYGNFVKDSAGYGLAQWTYWSRKQALLNHAKSSNKSIGDLEMQLGFLIKELTSYGLMPSLKGCKSVLEASNLILLKFEKPAGMNNASTQSKRAGYGQAYYDKYATKTTGGSIMTEKELRAKVVGIAEAWLGCKESDGSHKQIIDIYNAHKPLARGYKVKYTDAWCSTFASAVAIKAGLTDIIPTECGCEKHIALFQKLGRWQENDAYVPSAGDYIFYDWQDSGVGDNAGSADHVGIVVSVSGSTIKVIEGNKSNAVGYRSLAVNGRYIRGFGVPDYAGKTGVKASTVTPNNTVSDTKSNVTTIKIDAAQKFDKNLAGAYKTAANLNLRAGAGTGKALLTVMPKGASVRNYGYYTLVGNVKWLYVQYTSNGKTYTGFCSSTYLKK